MVIEIEYTDGRRHVFGTNPKEWTVSRSPITYSSIYGGENYDARLEDSLIWQKPLTIGEQSFELKLQNGTEVIQRRTIQAKKYWKTEDGKFLYDFGQNFAGIVNINVKGKAGQRVTIFPSETLRNGKINQGPFFFVASKPVEVCQATRGKRCKMGRTGDFSQAPYFGYCAAQNTYYFGYKLHTVCGLSGVIHSYDLSKASIDDRKFMKDVKRVYHDSKMYGDKGYIGRICSLICLRNEISILTEAYYFHLQKSAYNIVKEACSQCNQHLITRQSALFYSSPTSVFSLRVFICPPYTVDLGA